MSRRLVSLDVVLEPSAIDGLVYVGGWVDGDKVKLAFAVDESNRSVFWDLGLQDLAFIEHELLAEAERWDEMVEAALRAGIRRKDLPRSVGAQP